MKKECKCDKCKSACKQKPGWFKPGEPEKVAEYLGITLKELFDTKLMVDWWESDEDVFIIAPAIKDGDIGEEYPANPQGECVFFKDGLCSIHAVKPFECKSYMHTDTDAAKRHEEVKDSWDKKKHQDQIKELLGRNPYAKEYGLFDSLMW